MEDKTQDWLDDGYDRAEDEKAFEIDEEKEARADLIRKYGE